MTRYQKAVRHAQDALEEAYLDGVDTYNEAYRREAPFFVPTKLCDVLNEAWLNGWDSTKGRAEIEEVR